MRVLVIARFVGSLLNFRGLLLATMVARGLDVHVAVTGELAKAMIEWETTLAQWKTRQRAEQDRIAQRFSIEQMAAAYAAVWQE